jgi:predicted RND superfamily exporter protein
VLVYPKLNANAAQGRRQIGFARSVRATAERVDPHAEVAGSIILSADIIDSITRDGLLASCLSFLAVTLLTALILGSRKQSMFVIASLCTGTLWMVGTLGFWDIKLNFVNFAVLPITFGIGIDYAVNLYQRYREVGPGGAPQALATSGGAVALCSLTTIVGYSALLVADNRAIFSFGLTAVVGEITCLSAALIGLPALLTARDRWGTTLSVGAQSSAA